ncbi:N-acetylneuraminate synthase family protein [Hansschlegelia beijingensis]
MVEVAARECRADVAKFQKRNNRELLSPKQYGEPHPVPANAYGESYGAHREALEFSVDQHAELKAYCEELGVVYATSVWDMTSARDIAGLNPALIKIPSATNLNFELQGWLCENFAGEIHVSTGMTTRDEIEAVVAFYEQRGRAQDVVLYACTSGYPVSFDDLCLLEVARLRDVYEGRVKQIGFSGHHLGIAADVAALTLGAAWVERHFTLDRTWKGTDHAASLEPDGLRRLCRDLRNVEIALSYKDKDLLDVEEEQRKKLKWLPGLRAVG